MPRLSEMDEPELHALMRRAADAVKRSFPPGTMFTLLAWGEAGGMPTSSWACSCEPRICEHAHQDVGMPPENRPRQNPRSYQDTTGQGPPYKDLDALDTMGRRSFPARSEIEETIRPC
jgi:hypothetical protein